LKITKSKNLSVLFLAIIIVALVATIAPVSCVEYKAGVTAGKFAEYQITYESDIPDDSPVIDDRPGWFEIEVLSVSGIDVTVRLLARGNDGSIPEGSGNNYVCNIEDGSINNMYSTGGPMDTYPRFLLMAADLPYIIKGTEMFEQDGFAHFAFDNNEMQTYLGTSRNVNVFSDTITTTSQLTNDTGTWDQTTTITETIVFDKATGMLLGAMYESRETSPDQLLGLKVTTRLIDTNVLEHAATDSLAPSPSIPELPYLSLPFLLATLTIGAILYKIKQNRKNTTQP